MSNRGFPQSQRRPSLEANGLNLAAFARAAVLAASAMTAPALAEGVGQKDQPPERGAPLTEGKADTDLELSVEVGGAPMVASKTIFENAANSRDHTRFVADAEAVGLSETLSGAGPFTLFAPMNKAFQNLPKNLSDQLAKPENASMLKQVLSYHVLLGKYSAADFIGAIKTSGGKATFKTLEGDELSLQQDGRRLEILDAKGGKATVIISDVNQKNGVIHVIDAVLLPKS